MMSGGVKDDLDSVKEEEKKTQENSANNWTAFKEKTDAFINNMKTMLKEKERREKVFIPAVHVYTQQQRPRQRQNLQNKRKASCPEISSFNSNYQKDRDILRNSSLPNFPARSNSRDKLVSENDSSRRMGHVETFQRLQSVEEDSE